MLVKLTPWLVSGPGLDHENDKECEAQEENKQLEDNEYGVRTAHCIQSP